MSNPADEPIAELIDALCAEANRCRFKLQHDQVQIYVNQIAQLRASMNPVIVQKKPKD